ncbi:acetyl-coenzyme A synthetase [Peptococcaceae bacterium CEB3]|nr:acetyl-coenzyme A synthetase [Peptococcaceae bacterium CEB3]
MAEDSQSGPSYEEVHRDFKWEVGEYFNFARDVIDHWAETPEKLALWWVDDAGREVKKTFREISENSKRFAKSMQALGIRRGDVIMVILPRYAEWWEIFIGALRLGAVIAPGTTQLTAKDIQYRVQAAQAAAFISDEETAPKLEEVLAACPSLRVKMIAAARREGWVNYDEALSGVSSEFETANTRSDENALMYFTSGTVGYPKMTVHTHASYPYGHMVTGKYWLDLGPDDLHWNLSDTGWAKAAWSSIFGPWNMGAAIFVHHSNRFDPKKTLELLQQYPITTLCGAPTNYRMLVLEDLKQYKFPTLRHCVGAGEPLNPEVIKVWQEATGLVIRDGYGQTETVLVLGNFPYFEPRFGSMGKPTPGFDVQVVDREGNIAPADEEGDVAIRVEPVRPVGLFKEYYGDPERTASTYRGDWYPTGDRAYRDRDGYFWFVGRSDDVILTSGYRIGPFEVESAILEHPAVAESAVVSSPDDLRGEVVKAFVILAPGYEASDELKKELQEHVKRVTAPYKYPRKIEFVTALPKTVSGKIRRVELRRREWEGYKRPASSSQ